MAEPERTRSPRRTERTRWPPGRRRTPEAIAFDPLAALTDTHRLAIETAQASFRSFARAVGDGAGGGGFGARRVAPGEQADDGLDDGMDAISFADLRRTVTRSLDLYLELAERLMDTATRSLEDTLRARGVTATGGRREQPWTPVVVEAQPGEVASAPVWLHNMAPDPMTAATFVPTDLTAHDGSVLPAACVTLDPPSLAEVPPRASASATLSIRVGDGVAPGTYVGHLLVSPLAGVVVPIRLDVHPGRDGAGDDRAGG